MIRDVYFYRFLKDAIIHKYRFPNDGDFHTIEYNPWIYKWARDTFRELKAPLEYQNIQNRPVLEKIYTNLAKDATLKALNNPDLALAQKEYELSEIFHLRHESEKASAEKAAQLVPAGAVAGETPATMQGTVHAPSFHLPATKTTATTGNEPTLKTEEPNKPFTETAKTAAVEEAQKIVTTKTAVPEAFTKAFEDTKPPAAGTSQTAQAPQPNQSAPSVGAAPKLAFQTSPAGNAAKNAGSALQRFTGVNLGRIGRGLGGIATGVGRGITGPGLTGAYNLLGKGGNGVINFGTRLSHQASGLYRPSFASPKKRVWLWALGLFMLMFVFSLFSSLPGSEESIGEASPETGAPQSTLPVIREGHSCVTNANFVPFTSYQNIQPGQYSYVCGHCRPIFNAIDTGVNSAGGTQVLAVVDGVVEDITNPIGGTALWLTGDDGQNYYYAHLAREGLVTGSVKAGQPIGTIASASDRAAKNNGVAHVHFSAGTRGNRQDFGDPANIPAGPLLDSWCGNNVCGGRPNAAYACGQ